MDIATPLVYRHAHRIRGLVALLVLIWSAAVLLAFVAQLLAGENGVPMPDPPRLGPFRWEPRSVLLA